MHDHRPSATATLIARSLVLVARDPRLAGLVSDASVESSLACLTGREGRSGWWWRVCAWAWFRGLLGWLERRILPGITLHYALRKRRIGEAVEAAIDAGARQVVVLAAGFDGLANHCARRHPGLVCFEVDHPATQAIKRRAVAELPLPTGAAGVRLLPADLAIRSLRSVLDDGSGFTAALTSVVVAEGFLMYLTEDQVVALFRDIAGSMAAGSRLIFTVMERRDDGAIGFPAAHPRVEHWLRQQGEPFRWGIARRELEAFLAATGFVLEGLSDHLDLARRYLPAEWPPGAAGELVVTARRAESADAR